MKAQLRDNSRLYRFGLKGPRASQWLQQRDARIPAAANTWVHFDESDQLSLIARLGTAEFLIEYEQANALGKQISHELEQTLDGVYPVLREDREFLLLGNESGDVLAQVCNIDFRTVSRRQRHLVMTMMAGVAVLVIPQGEDYRIWCDPSYGEYLWSTLHDVIRGV